MALEGQDHLHILVETVRWKAPQADRVVLEPLHLQAAVQALQAAAVLQALLALQALQALDALRALQALRAPQATAPHLL